MKLQIKKLTDTAIVPVKAHATDSGFDLFSDENILVGPGETVIISTGIAIALPEGYEAQIRPKSGITFKTDFRVQLGTVDEPYRGEIRVIADNKALPMLRVNDEGEITMGYTKIVENLACENVEFYENVPINSIYVERGTKIAQMVIVKVGHPEIEIVEELNTTDRGNAGFGSTGVRYE